MNWMRGYFIGFVLMLLPLITKAQPLPVFIAIKADNFFVDAIGNTYFIKGSELLKYNNKGQFFSRYSNKQIGQFSSLDVSNPLKVLTFCQEQGLILFLDNMLGKQTSQVYLSDIGFPNATLVCNSNNNGFWLYNPVNFELIRFNEDHQVINRVSNLNQVLGTDLHPDYLIEYNNQLYLNNPETGILVFDIYGTYYKQIPFTGLKDFQLTNKTLFFKKKNLLLAYDFQSLNTDTLQLPDSCISIRFQNNKIYQLFPHCTIISERN